MSQMIKGHTPFCFANFLFLGEKYLHEADVSDEKDKDFTGLGLCFRFFPFTVTCQKGPIVVEFCFVEKNIFSEICDVIN